ncbi:hypothetical protein D0T84_13845 [Dysgonomonas sp. 521]|uniref:hypothetical protein n=1 Tax=Dysgonomonas sp. 521 TaxID=2302932 RepID=UPI0013D2C112|nr:hypothetical protein [Dysgonomonas sp. 521]NDV95986.1 hypothetical protein [Dysgonomonas sp. 521]
MKTSRPFTMSYALIPSAMLLTSIGLLNFDSSKTLSYTCLAASAILLVIALVQIIKDKIRESNQKFT